MSKIVQAFLSGIFFTFILDFFLFLGIQINYIDRYDINLYYNVLFADNQNIFLFSFFTLFIGYFIVYQSAKTSLIVIGTLCILSLATLIEPIGYIAGSNILMSKNVTLHTKRFSYTGDICYNGRKNISFYDYKLERIIALKKNELVGKQK